MIFNEKLMELRKSKGWSQEGLGNQLNVTRQTVSKWELGQTTPEMDKLIEMSKLFGVTIDDLVGNQNEKEKVVIYPKTFHYEYKSKRTLFGLPLVHVNVGVGIRHAKGILAIGTIARGVVAIGAVSMGILAFGALSLGLLAFGALSLALAAFGGIAIGGIAVGGCAVGLIAIGGFAFGLYSVGGCAIAARVAMGGYAQGHIAIGDKAVGEYAYNHISQLTQDDFANIKEVILREYPNIWRWLLNLFVS